jgi:hypothetical protein
VRKRQGQRTDLEDLQAAIDSGDQWEILSAEHFTTLAKYSRFAREYYNLKAQQKVMEKLKIELETAELRAWQKGILDICEEEPHNRKVMWFWESEGNVGKSFMAQYLQVMKQAILLQPMKKSDMVHILSKTIHQSDIVIFDLTRSSEEGSVKVVYEVIEMIKNRHICSGKYDSDSFNFSKKHVIVFSNYAPDMSALSADRWKIVHLVGLALSLPIVLDNTFV